MSSTGIFLKETADFSTGIFEEIVHSWIGIKTRTNEQLNVDCWEENVDSLEEKCVQLNWEC